MSILLFAMQRLHLNYHGDRDIADTVSLLNKFASITGKHMIIKVIAIKVLTLVLFTES